MWPWWNRVAWLASHAVQELEACQPGAVGRRGRQGAAVAQAVAMPAGQLATAQVQGLEISLVCARTLQEGPQPAIQAWYGRDLGAGCDAAEHHRHALGLQHHQARRALPRHRQQAATSLLGRGQQRGQVQAQRGLDDRHAVEFGFLHVAYQNKKRTGHCCAVRWVDMEYWLGLRRRDCHVVV